MKGFRLFVAIATFLLAASGAQSQIYFVFTSKNLQVNAKSGQTVTVTAILCSGDRGEFFEGEPLTLVLPQGDFVVNDCVNHTTQFTASQDNPTILAFIRGGDFDEVAKVTFKTQPFKIEATLLTPSKSPETIGTDDPASAEAHLPLGSKFQIRLLQTNPDGTTSGVPVALFKLGAASFVNTLDSGSVFPNNVTLAYTQPANDTGQFQAVHLGSQPLTITPNDTSISPVQINIVIETPTALGSRHPEVDALVFPIADRKGILPQYVKGQMHQESGGIFNPRAFRYEPLNGSVGDFGVISRHKDLRATGNPYTHYRFATQTDCRDNALATGDLLRTEDVSPRSKYNICPPDQQCRPIDPADSFVTALAIITANPRQNWQKNPNFRLVTSAAARGDACNSIWTAQTSLASSYGFFQVIYAKAIDLRWPGADGGLKNPSFLFDTPENLAIHGGSSELGTDIVEHAVVQLNSAESSNPNFNVESDLQDIFKVAWHKYNADPAYPANVLMKTSLYPPQPARSIFGGSQ